MTVILHVQAMNHARIISGLTECLNNKRHGDESQQQGTGPQGATRPVELNWRKQGDRPGDVPLLPWSIQQLTLPSFHQWQIKISGCQVPLFLPSKEVIASCSQRWKLQRCTSGIPANNEGYMSSLYNSDVCLVLVFIFCDYHELFLIVLAI